MTAAPELPTGTVTFLFTDIEGSTRLLREHGRDRYFSLLARHNELVRSALEAHAGVEVDRQGDAFFAAFGTASDAVGAAVSAQVALAGEAWPGGATVPVRMGVHTSEASLGTEGYVGFAVHQAARVAAAAKGGQILLTGTTAKLVEHDLDPGLRLRELGNVVLADLGQPELLVALEIEGVESTRVRPIARGARIRSATPLLEREDELTLLRERLETAEAGEGALAVVEGSAGIGKSRLLSELRAIGSGREMRVLSARGGEFESEYAFGIVRQLFEPLLAGASDDLRALLLGGAAGLVEPLFRLDQAQVEPEGIRDSSFAIQHGLYWLAANSALERPTLLVVDDLHWADRPSLRWLDYLARRLEGLPLLILVATRPPAQSHDPALLSEFLINADSAIIEPGPLSVQSVSELARERFASEADEAFSAAVALATGGNPLFVSALLDTLARERVAPTAEQARRVLELGPRAISRAISVRLARLPEPAVELARAAAVLGDGVELQHASELASLELVPAGRAASRLVRVDLFRAVDPIEFFHPVVRAAVYDMIDAGARIVMHRRAAEILGASGAPPERVASHLLQVSPAGDAVVARSLRAAADRALANGAHDTALTYLRRALAEPPDPSERFDILLELGLAERRLGMPESVERLATAVREADDPVRRGRAALEYSRTLFHSNRPADALDVLFAAEIELGGADPDLSERLEAEIISSARWLSEYYPLAAERLSSIREGQLHGGVGTAQLLAALAVDEAARFGSRDRAIDLARRALSMQVLREEGAIGFYHALNALVPAGATEEAEGAYREAVDRARREGNLFNLAGALGFLGYVLLGHGDLRGAELDLREGLELIRAAGPVSTVYQWYAGTLANLLIEQGDLGQAGALVESAALDAQRADNQQLFFLRAARGKLHLAAREHEAALTVFETIGAVSEAGGSTNPNWLPWRSWAAIALYHLGRREEAVARVVEELELAQRWGAPVGIAVSLRSLGLVEGGEEGLGRLGEAVKILAATPARLEYARALVEHGAALRRANHGKEARERLRSGLALAHSLGAVALSEQAAGELAAMGVRPRKLLQTGLETLTGSERRVAQMAAQEMSNKEIAQALFVTVKTVEVHLSSVYRKLHLTSRRQLGQALGEHSSAPVSPA